MNERSRRARIVAGGALLAAVSCAELGTGIGNVSYLAFDGIPWPALIAGDTLRDSLGVASPLRAHAYDARGREITEAPFRYFTLDTGVVVDSNGTMRATTRRDGTVRVVASLGGLPSDDRLLRVFANERRESLLPFFLAYPPNRLPAKTFRTDK